MTVPVQWLSVLILAAAAVLFVAWKRRRADSLHDEASARLLAVVYFIPAVLWLVMNVGSRTDATRVVLELRGIGFRTEPNGSLASRVGGAKEAKPKIVASDIWVGGIPETVEGRAGRAGLAGTISYASASGAPAALSVFPPRLDRATGVISTPQGIAGSQSLVDVDEVCLASRCWRYSIGAQTFTSGAETIAVPRRLASITGVDSVRLDLHWSRPPAIGQHIYAVEGLAHSTGGTANDASRPKPYLRSFFFYCDRSIAHPSLCLMALDSGVYVKRNGQLLGKAGAAMPVGDGDRLAVYSLPERSEEFEWPGLIDRRTAVVRSGQRSYALEFDTPEVHSLDATQFHALELQSYVSHDRPSVVLSAGAAELPDRSLHLCNIAQSAAWETIGVFDLPARFPYTSDSSFRIVSARGTDDYQLGKTIWAGIDNLSAFRLYVVQPPILLPILFLFLQFVKWRTAAGMEMTVAQALVGGALELLCFVRMEMGYRVWAMPPHEQAGVQLALFTIVVPAWIYLASVAPEPRRRATPWWGTARLVAGAGCLFSAAWAGRIFEGSRRWPFVLLPLLAMLPFRLITRAVVRKWTVLAPRIRSMVLSTGIANATRRVGAIPWAIPAVGGIVAALFALLFLRGTTRWGVTGAVLAVAVVITLFLRYLQAIARGQDQVRARIVYIAVALSASRLVLVALGFKESLSTGGLRIALSVVYVPLCVVVEGLLLVWWWQRLSIRRAVDVLDLVSVGAVLVLLWIVPAWVTSDNGLALVNLPPVMAAVAIATEVLRHRGRLGGSGSRWRTALSGAPLAAILLLSVLAFVPVVRLVVSFMPISQDRLVSLAADANFARLLHSATPERLQEAATKKSEDLAVTSAVLQRYINTGFLGYGYGHSDVTPQFGRTALRDFAPAVFIASEWGLCGIFALLLIHGAIAGIGLQLQPWSDVTRDPRVMNLLSIAGFAVLTLGGVSIYMIFANYELVLLTGRNVYLLGLDSAADVFESIALFWIFGCATAAARDAMRP